MILLFATYLFFQIPQNKLYLNILIETNNLFRSTELRQTKGINGVAMLNTTTTYSHQDQIGRNCTLHIFIYILTTTWFILKLINNLLTLFFIVEKITKEWSYEIISQKSLHSFIYFYDKFLNNDTLQKSYINMINLILY